MRFVARCVKDPTKLGDMLPVGFGDAGAGVIDDELAEEGEGRRWDDHGSQGVNTGGKKDVVSGSIFIGGGVPRWEVRVGHV